MIISFHSPLNPDQWNGHTSDKRLININALGRLFWMALVARNIKLLYFWAYLKIKPPYIFIHMNHLLFFQLSDTLVLQRENLPGISETKEMHHSTPRSETTQPRYDAIQSRSDVQQPRFESRPRYENLHQLQSLQTHNALLNSTIKVIN